MMSKFGLLGDTEKLLSTIRCDAGEALAGIKLVRRALLDIPVEQINISFIEKLCTRLYLAEDKLKGLVER